MVDPEPRQRPVQVAQQRPAGDVDDPLAGAAADARLGRDHHVVALDDRGEQLADQLLAGAVAVPRRGVEQGASGSHERLAADRAPRARRCRCPTVIVPRPRRDTFRPVSRDTLPHAAEASARTEPFRAATATTLAPKGSATVTRNRCPTPVPARVKLGLNLGYVLGADASTTAEVVALAQEAERLGYSVAWAAEAYGSDAATVLAYIAAQTERSTSAQRSSRSRRALPAMTAMTAATLDLLCGGRFRLGLGVSGSAGLRGLARRPVRQAARAHPRVRRRSSRRHCARRPSRTTASSSRCRFPTGPGKALKLTVHPAREHIPIYLAAVGPKNLELAGEIADGWLAIFFSPGVRRRVAGAASRPVANAPDERQAAVRRRPRPCRSCRRRRRGVRRRRCARTPRSTSAAWAAGSRTSTTSSPAGWATRTRRKQVQDLYLDRQHREAMAAVPLSFIDQTSLLGPPERIAERLHAYAEAGVTTLTVADVRTRRSTSGSRHCGTSPRRWTRSGLGD